MLRLFDFFQKRIKGLSDRWSELEQNANKRFDDALRPLRGNRLLTRFSPIPWWLWCVFGCVVCVISQLGLMAAKLHPSVLEWPSVLAELHYAGNQVTGRDILRVWRMQDDRSPLEWTIFLNIVLIPCYVPLLLLAIDKVRNQYLDGAKQWYGVFGALCVGLGIFALCENGFDLAWLIWPDQLDGLRAAFVFASAKTLCFGAVFLYVLFGWLESAWFRGAWDVVRVCGFSLFACIVAPLVLLFGGQGAAIFGATVAAFEPTHDPMKRPADYGPFFLALAMTLVFSLMCWGAARYAVTYKGQKGTEPAGQTIAAGQTVLKRGRTPQNPAAAQSGENLLERAKNCEQARRGLVPTSGDPVPNKHFVLLTEDDEEEKAKEASKIGDDVEKGWNAAEKYIPRFCGVAPGAILAVICCGVSLAAAKEVPALSWGEKNAWILGAGFLLVAVGTGVWIGFVRRLIRKPSPALVVRKLRQRNVPEPQIQKHLFWLAFVVTAYRQRVFNAGYIVFSFLLGALAVAGCFGQWVLQYARDLGPLAAWFLSFTLMVPFFTFLVWSGRRKNKPFLFLFLAYGYLVNAANLNDDHGLRHQYSPIVKEKWQQTLPLDHTDPAKPPKTARTLNNAFDAWLANRPDAKKYKGKAYPVVFVAAAGGGIVAGSLVTATMAQFHQPISAGGVPGLPDHLFAISSVSGGSLGAATYVTLRRNLPGDLSDTELSEREKMVFTSDMLSPSVASLLGPELVQRFLPVAIPRHVSPVTYPDYTNEYVMDRGRALDLAFEHAIENGLPGATAKIQETITDYPTPAQSNLPALFLNTTCVQTGERMVVSTLRPDDQQQPSPQTETTPRETRKETAPLPFETLYDVDPNVDLPLSTAACLSARFPVVSPPAFLPQWRAAHLNGTAPGRTDPLTVKRSYVDGGYCENTGVQTVLDIISALEAQNTARPDRPRWTPVIISIHMNDQDVSKQTARNDELPAATRAGAPRRGKGFDEVLGPAGAFFAGWGGPPRPELMRARLRYGTNFVEMNFPKPVLLSWYMSEAQYDQATGRARELLQASKNGTPTAGDRLRKILAK